ncbi:MAG: PAS domain S-box protein [Syntrophales bacterium]
MEKPLRLLIVEDSEDDALLTILALKKGGYDPVYERVEDAGAMRKALQEKSWNVILCDYQMPQFNGLAAIAILKETGIDIPLIIVSGAIGEETAVECMRFGACDYIMKSNLSRLASAIERELKEAESRLQRKRAEEALRESEERYRTILENIEDGYFEVDIAGNLTFFSDPVCRMVGITRAEMMGMNNRQYTDKENSQILYQAFNKVFRTGEPSKGVDYEIIGKDGTKLYIESSVSLIRNASGQPIGFRGIMRNITEHKQAEKEVVETLQQLQETRDMLIQFEKHAAVGRLATGVAHELLNPASIISSQLQFMEDETLTDQARESVRICREQLQRIAKISHDLLQSSAKKPTVLVGGDLRRVIEVGLQMTERRRKEDHVQVEYDPPPAVIPVKMERDRLVKVMVNLILNACDAMTGNDSKRMIIAVYRPEVSSRRPSVRLIVADNGHGILAGELDKIFEPFFTRKDPGKGTGLGLSVSKGIIQEHGGTIHAENNDMGGASFIVELPLDHP